MSRVGKLPIPIPDGVTISLDQRRVGVKGPKGQLEQQLPGTIDVIIDDKVLTVRRKDDEKKSKAWHGLTRALINNMVTGVTKGFEKTLEVSGVGFRISGGGQALELSLGFSHPVRYTAPEGVNLTVNKMNITVSGINRQQVGQVAAEIRKLKKPEPYKGKGIKYEGERLIRKSGKSGKDK